MCTEFHVNGIVNIFQENSVTYGKGLKSKRFAANQQVFTTVILKTSELMANIGLRP